MATMTIAQALASNATGIKVVDTPVNIASVANNTSLMARVTSFAMSANGASSVGQAKLLYALGSKFSRGGYTYTVRDTVAALTDPTAASALKGLGAALSVYDTATNLLAAATSPLMAKAVSTVLSVNATLTLANLLKLEALPFFSVLPGQTITLADTAANLLAMTAAANRAAITAFQVVSKATVTLAQALTLSARPSFAVINNATLTVVGNAAAMTSAPASVITLGHISGVAISISDTFANLSAAAAGLKTISQSVTRLAVSLTTNASATTAQLAQIQPLGSKFSLAGKTLTLADTAQNILSAAPALVAMTQATKILQSATITSDQLVALTGLPSFSLDAGVKLTVSGTLAALKALTPAQLAFVSAETVQDTVTALTAAAGMPALATAIIAQLDAAHYTAAQAAQLGLLANGGTTLTIAAMGQVTALTVADTLQNLATFAPMLTGLLTGHGSVVISPTNSNVALAVTQALNLLSLNAIDMTAYGVSVADSGAAIAANAAQLFGHGFASINVVSGVFAGTVAQLLDPALHFSGATSPFALAGTFASGIGTPSAQLASNATVGANQLIVLSLLPNFGVAAGVTLQVQDTAATLAANAALIDTYATAVTVSDVATVTAAQAAALAGIAQIVGTGNFSLGGHALTITDSVAALTNPANAAGVALATTLVLASDAVATAAQVAQLIGLGSSFSLNGHALTVIDSAGALGTVAANGSQLAAVNAWGGQVLLSADATLSVAGAQVLKGFTGFSAGNHQLTISDTAANLLNSGAAGALASATAVQLSTAATVTVAAATTLAGLHGFATNGKALTVSDTPAHLAAMGAAAAAFATSETFVTRNSGNAADFTLSAAQLTALTGLANLTPSGLITLSDTVDALLALAPSFGSPSFGTLQGRVAVALSGDAVTTVANAKTLANLPAFSVAGHMLTIHDTPVALLAPTASTALGFANTVGIGGPATVNVATATALAALPHFAADAFALTVADTPANLAHMPAGLTAIATSIVVGASSGQPIGDYTISTADFATLASLPNLSFAGFSGTITVLDSAANLGSLAAAMASAPSGSALAIARGAATFALSNDATVSAAALATLASLPSLSLNGHGLTLQDAPSALTGTVAGLSLVTGVTLANNPQAWTVTAADAARLATLPGFSTGTAGMAVVDGAAAILASQNAAGVAAASAVQMNADATVSATDAMHLAALATFTTGTSHLTIGDRAAALAGLSSDAAALASSIVLQGGGLVSVAQFGALRALPNLSTDGGTLIVVDSAANLATLAGTPTTLASLIMLSSNATLTGAQAQALALLPHFVGGGAQLSIVDSAANLLHVTGPGTRPDNWDGELLATTVTLSADAMITAAQAAEFATLGTHFSRGGHMLTVSDTAANLTASGNAPGLGLATGIALGASATVSALQAAQLAGIAGLTLGSGVGLTVQDTVANLIGLSASVTALATAEQLAPGTSVVVTAQQAAQLAALGHFSNVGATVTVRDTVANWNSATGWLAAANAYVVADTPANLAGAAGTPLLSTASSVTLSAGGDIDAATAAVLAGIAHFSNGGIAVTVTDTAAHISAGAAAIMTVGATARITTSQPISATQADALVALNTAGKLQILPGNMLAIQDSYAALSSPSHAAALALAGNVVVLDTLANVLAAAAHGWGSLAMTYVLSSGGTITAAQGATLAALGTHLQLNQMSLVLADTAAAVAGAGATLSTLDIVARVTDTTAHVLANIGGLIARGDHLTQVTLTDSTPVTAAQADALQYLAPVLTGSVAVNDTAVAVGQNLPNLLALGAHLGSVVVTDTAVHVTPWVATLGGLGASLTVALTDTMPVSAATVASLVPLLARLATSTVLAVQDTGLAIAGQVSALTALGNMLGTVTLADGTTVSAAVAAGVAPIASHLGTGVQLDVSDTAAALTGAATPLASLRSAGRIHTIVAAMDTAANIIAAAGALGTIGATAAVLDSAAHVLANLDALQAVSGSLITSITLTNVVAPVLTMTVNTMRADHAALQLINSAFSIGISDTAANIQADLASGHSTLAGSLGWLATVVVSDMGAITLTTAQAAAAGVNDGPMSVLAKMTGGTLAITGAAVADFPILDALAVHATSISITDTLAHVQADLIAGSSKLLAHVTMLGSVTVSDTGVHTLTLTVPQLRADAGVLAKISGTFTVDISDSAAQVQAELANPASTLLNFTHLGHISFTDAGTPSLTLSVGQLTTTAAVLGDIVTSYRVVVNDTASAVETDLALGMMSKILGLGAVRGGIFVPTGSTIHLSASQVAVTGVVAALASMTGLSGLAISDASVAQVPVIHNYGINGTTISVHDTSSAVQADLTGGTSQLELRAALLTSVTLSDGGTPTFALNLTQFGAAAPVLNKVSSPYQIAVSDVASAVQADLQAGASSLILSYPTTSVIVPANSAMTFTAAQATFNGVVAKLASIVGLTGVTVSNATFDQFSTIVGHGVPGLHVSVVDTAAHLQADMASGASVLIANSAAVSTVTVSDGASVNIVLSLAQIVAAAALTITGTYHLTVSDTAAAVQADLLLGAGSIIMHVAPVTHVVLTTGDTVTVTAAAATGGAAAAMVGATGLNHFVVTGVSVAQIPTILNTGVAHAGLQVSDSAGAVQGDLGLGSGSKILPNISSLTSISLSAPGTLTLTAAQAVYAGVADVIAHHISNVTGLVINDATVSGSTGLAAIAALNITNTTINVSDLATNVQADLMATSSSLMNALSTLGAITFTDSSTPTITLSLAKLAAESAVVAKMSGFTLAIGDSAAHVAGDLTSGSSVILGPPGISHVSLTGGDTSMTLTDAQLTSTVQAVIGTIGNLATLYVTATPVADVATVAAYTMGSVAVRIDVSDTAAAVQSDLTGSGTLAAAGVKLHSITLSDPTTVIHLDGVQVHAGAAVLGTITSAYQLAVTDTAGAIATELSYGASSALLGLGAHLNSTTLTIPADITMTLAAASFAGVAALVNGISNRQNFVITGVAIGNITSALGLGVSNTILSISDTAADVQADLVAAGNHLLETNIAAISTITMTGTAVALTVAEAGNASAVLTKIGAAHVDLTIADSAAAIQADLALAVSSGSQILNNQADHISLSSGTAISLTQAQLAASGVSAAVGSITGLTTLHVTATPVAQIGTVSGYTMSGITVDMDVYDTGATIEADLQAGGSTLVAAKSAGKLHAVTLSDVTAPTIHLDVAHLEAGASVLGLIGSSPGYTVAVTDSSTDVMGDLTSALSLAGLGMHLGAITLTDPGANITLTATQALATGVGAVVSAIGNRGGFNVSGATVAQVTALVGLSVSATHIAVSDAFGTVQTDLTTGSHVLAGNIAAISSITLTGGSDLSLTVAQANAGSAVLAAIGDANVNLTVTDTAANVQADLAQVADHAANPAHPTSVILSNLADHITLSDVNAISLTETQATASGVPTKIALISGVSLTVTDVLAADVDTLLSTTLSGITTHLVVKDTLAHVQSALASLRTNYAQINAITLTDSSTPTFTAAFAVSDLTADDHVLQLLQPDYRVTISDTAAHVQTDLQLASPKLAAYSSHITSIALTDGGTPTIALTMAQVSNAGTVLTTMGTASYVLDVTGAVSDVQADLQLGSSSRLQAVAALGDLGTITLSGGSSVTLSVDQLAHIGGVLASTHLAAGTIVVSDTIAHIQTDLALGVSSVLVGALTKIALFTIPGGAGSISLTASQIQVAGIDDGANSAIGLLAAAGATLIATNVHVADVATMNALGSGGTVRPASLKIMDSAANIQSDIAGSHQIASSSVSVTSVATNETTLSAAAAATIYTAFTTKFDESGLTINDTAANLLATQGSTPLVLTGAAHVTLSNNPTGLTAAQATTLVSILGGSLTGHTMTIADTSANLLAASQTVLGLATTVTLAAPETLAAATATQLASLPHFSAGGAALTVQDTSANLLNAGNAAGISAATTTKLLANEVVSAATLTALVALHGYSAGTTSLTVQDTASNIIALTDPALGFTALASVLDTTAGFNANVTALQAAVPGHSHQLSVTLTDAVANSKSIIVDAAAYQPNAATYAAVTNVGVLKVTGNASGLAAITNDPGGQCRSG